MDHSFEEFFENAPLGLSSIGPDGRILRANRAELAMLGYTQAEYIGHHISEFHINPDIVHDLLTRLISRGAVREYEARLRCRNGMVKDVLIAANGLWEMGRLRHFQCFTFDITGRKRWEMGQAEMAAIAESSEDAIVLRTMEGTIIGWNASAERMFGYKASEAIGQPARFLMPADHADDERQMLERLRKGQRPKHFETVRVRKDGSYVDVSESISPIKDESGRLIGIAQILRDMTERKQWEDALQEKIRDLELFHDMAVTRELKLIELEKELERLKEQLSQLSHSES